METENLPTYQVFVKTLSEKTVVLRLNLCENVSQLKKILHEDQGVAECHQMLLFEGKELNDANYLSDYGVGEDSNIIMSLKVRGGMQALETEPQSSEFDFSDFTEAFDCSSVEVFRYSTNMKNAYDWLCVGVKIMDQFLTCFISAADSIPLLNDLIRAAVGATGKNTYRMCLGNDSRSTVQSCTDVANYLEASEVSPTWSDWHPRSRKVDLTFKKRGETCFRIKKYNFCYIGYPTVEVYDKKDRLVGSIKVNTCGQIFATILGVCKNCYTNNLCYAVDANGKRRFTVYKSSLCTCKCLNYPRMRLQMEGQQDDDKYGFTRVHYPIFFCGLGLNKPKKGAFELFFDYCFSESIG